MIKKRDIQVVDATMEYKEQLIGLGAYIIETFPT